MYRFRQPEEIVKLSELLKARRIGHEFVLADNMNASAEMGVAESIFKNRQYKLTGATIVLCFSGSILYRVNLSEHCVGAGQVLVMLPGSIMEFVSVFGEMTMAIISFSQEYYEMIVNVSSQMRDNPVFCIPPHESAECLAIYNAMKNRLAADAGAGKQIVKGYMQALCSILMTYWKRSVSDMTDSGQGRRRELYRRFISSVQANYKSRRSVNFYADKLCVTPKYLSMVIKKESGRNASEFIDELVIFESKALLKSGDHTVVQISEMMGFPNPSFFSKYFKKHCGVSPTEYKHRFSGTWTSASSFLHASDGCEAVSG